jgi:hypothetical protein
LRIVAITHDLCCDRGVTAMVQRGFQEVWHVS